MEVEFSKKQYEGLIELVYLGNWMVNAIRSGREGDERIEKYENTAGYIFSFAKDFGLEEYVDFDEESARFFPSLELEMDEKIEQYRTEYEDNAFWHNLIDRLSWRDFLRKYGEEAVEEMEVEERREKHRPLEEKYFEEFAENGIESLEISN